MKICVEEMTAAMVELLQNKTLREKMKQKGIERADDFTWQNTLERYLKLYQKVIDMSAK